MSPPEEANLYPIFLKLEGRRVLVVGGGAVAERKIASLVAAGARIHVVAPEATDRIRRLARDGTVRWDARPFEDTDADGAWLLIAATSDPRVQMQAAGSAEARRVFAIAVDDPANASAYSGAVVKRAPFTIAISSSGATPALTRLVREIIEEVLPAENWVEQAKRLRAKWVAERTPTSDRFAELVKALKARD
jgi:siroheme synthase-like protein